MNTITENPVSTGSPIVLAYFGKLPGSQQTCRHLFEMTVAYFGTSAGSQAIS